MKTRIILAALFAAALFGAGDARADLTVTDGMVADDLLIQPDFSTGYDEHGSPVRPRNMAYAPGHGLIVTHTLANTVKIYDLEGHLNGAPSTTITLGNGATAPTAASIGAPDGLAYWPDREWLFVGDAFNRRVLVYDLSGGATNGMAANYVLGQIGFTTGTANAVCSGTASSPTPTACGMRSVFGLALDPVNAILYVGDAQNERITAFDVDVITNGEPAFAVLGQPDLQSQGPYRTCDGLSFGSTSGPATQCGIASGDDVLWDATSQTLFIMDHNRIVAHVLGADPLTELSTLVGIRPADYVAAQPDFTSVAAGDGPGQLDAPFFVGLHLSLDHANGRAYVADHGNCRVQVADISSGVEAGLTNLTATAFQSIGWNSLNDPGVSDPSPLGANCAADPGGTGFILTDDHRIAAPSDVLWIDDLGLLAVLDTFNDRVLLYFDELVEVTIVGGTGGASSGSGGTIVVSATASGGGSFGIVMPGGTQPLSGGSVVVTVGDGGGGTHPFIEIDASLPSGETKSVTMPYVDRDYCIDDSPGASVGTQSSCNSPKVRVKKQDLPSAGACVAWRAGDDLCRSVDGLSVTVEGLAHSALYTILDDDGDGVPDTEDWCPGTDLNGPVPTQNLKRPDYLSDGATVNGCNASQILACKGGDTAGQTKFGVPPGIVNVFVNLIGWAQDQNGDGIPDCLQQ